MNVNSEPNIIRLKEAAKWPAGNTRERERVSDSHVSVDEQSECPNAKTNLDEQWIHTLQNVIAEVDVYRLWILIQVASIAISSHTHVMSNWFIIWKCGYIAIVTHHRQSSSLPLIKLECLLQNSWMIWRLKHVVLLTAAFCCHRTQNIQS